VSYTNPLSHLTSQTFNNDPTSIKSSFQYANLASVLSSSAAQDQQLVNSEQDDTFDPAAQVTTVSNNSEYLLVNVTKVSCTLYPDKFTFND
jgi:hypothetical protein